MRNNLLAFAVIFAFAGTAQAQTSSVNGGALSPPPPSGSVARPPASTTAPSAILPPPVDDDDIPTCRNAAVNDEIKALSAQQSATAQQIATLQAANDLDRKRLAAVQAEPQQGDLQKQQIAALQNVIQSEDTRLNALDRTRMQLTERISDLQGLRACTPAEQTNSCDPSQKSQSKQNGRC